MKKSLRETVYHKYGGHCAYCGKKLEYKDMQVDHIHPKCFGGEDVIDNLNPSCRRCNHYKRGDGIEYLRTMLKTIHTRLQKEYLIKVALDYGVVEFHDFDGLFYFEKVEVDN